MQPIYKIKTGLLVCILLFTSHAYSQQTIEFSCGLVTIPALSQDSDLMFTPDYVLFHVLDPIRQSKADVEVRLTLEQGPHVGPETTIFSMRFYKDSAIINRTAYIDFPAAAAKPPLQLACFLPGGGCNTCGIYKYEKERKDTTQYCHILQELISNHLFSQHDIDVTTDTLIKLGITIPELQPGVHYEPFFQSYFVELKAGNQYKMFRINYGGGFFLAKEREPYRSIENILTIYPSFFTGLVQK